MAYTRRTLTKAIAEELVRKHGTISKATRAIRPDCLDHRGNPASFHGVRLWLSDAITGQKDDPKAVFDASEADKINKIKELLDESGIPIESIGKISKVRIGKHRGLTKNKEGEAEYHTLPNISIELSPSWEDGPAWPVVQPAAPIVIKPPKYQPRPRIGRTIVVLPDTQIGFLRNVDTLELTPIHDLQAIDCALQIVADIQPDQLGWIGDFLDFNEMSRWLQVEEFWRTTQPAIDAGHRILAEFEAAAGPHREQTWFIAGNHDRRIREYVQKNARAAFNLRPAQETPKSWPDLTVPRLLHFDKLGIEYCGEYPGSEKWITKELVARHNPEKKDAYDASVIAGHTHRMKRETFSHRTIHGARHHTLYEIGCLCRIDNYSDPSSLMRTSVPSDRGFVVGWTQGVAVVHVDDDGSFAVEQIEIHGGKAIYAGRVYSAKAVA